MINLLLCGNEKVFDGALTQLISITNRTRESVNCYIFTMNLERLNPNFKSITDNQIAFLNEVVKSKLLIEIRSTDTIRISIYAIKYTYTPRIVSSFTFFPFTFTILTAFGWIIVFSSRRMLFTRIRSLDTLIPPPVEPAEAPITITRSRTHLESSGHLLKSAVTNPVVVITDATWNAA